MKAGPAWSSPPLCIHPVGYISPRGGRSGRAGGSSRGLSRALREPCQGHRLLAGCAPYHLLPLPGSLSRHSRRSRNVSRFPWSVAWPLQAPSAQPGRSWVERRGSRRQRRHGFIAATNPPLRALRRTGALPASPLSHGCNIIISDFLIIMATLPGRQRKSQSVWAAQARGATGAQGRGPGSFLV